MTAAVSVVTTKVANPIFRATVVPTSTKMMLHRPAVHAHHGTSAHFAGFPTPRTGATRTSVRIATA